MPCYPGSRASRRPPCTPPLFASLPFHTVLFDFDGTLVDSAACGVEATQWAFADAGLNVPDAGVIIAKMGIPIEVSFGQMASHPLDEAGYEQLMARFRAKYREVADRGMKAFDGIAPLLQALKAQGVRTAIVTSKRSDVAARNLETAGLGGLIDVLVGSDKVAHCKPAPDAVHAGLAELARLRRGGRPVDETVMDEEREKVHPRQGRQGQGNPPLPVSWVPCGTVRMSLADCRRCWSWETPVTISTWARRQVLPPVPSPGAPTAMKNWRAAGRIISCTVCRRWRRC